ncbi:uncharacterized protein LOC114338438 isoform X2 [Diabrotica virgifera virgifera]|uniref:Uncharacterized protein n=1 Tax=Diabrotica virgifera virgifera TaxID=50390 RepID=A0ABM5JUC0_DIAVI|nr:uncharacterized protein LOC114338438 isoform X2 [Diabrotica virgifera virgifera]
MISVLRNVCKLKIPTRCVRTPHSLRPLRRMEKPAPGFPKYSVNSRSFRSLTTTSPQKNSFNLPTGTVNSNFRRHFPQKIKFGHPRSAASAENNKRDDISYEQYLHLQKEKQEKMHNSKLNKFCSSSQYKNKYLERTSSKQKRRHFTSEVKRVPYPKFLMPFQPKLQLYMTKRNYSTNRSLKGVAGDDDCFQYFQDRPIKKPSLQVPREQFATPVTPDFRNHRTGLPTNAQYGYNMPQKDNITADHKESQGITENESNIPQVADTSGTNTQHISKSQLPSVEVWTTQRPDSIFEGKTTRNTSGPSQNKKSTSVIQEKTNNNSNNNPKTITRTSVLENCRGIFNTLYRKIKGPQKRNAGSFHLEPPNMIFKDTVYPKTPLSQRNPKSKVSILLKDKYPWNSAQLDETFLLPKDHRETAKRMFSAKTKKNPYYPKDFSYSTNSSSKDKSTSNKVKYPWNLATDQIESHKSSRIVYCNPNNISATEPDLPKMDYIEQKSPLVVCRALENASYRKDNNYHKNTSNKKPEIPSLPFSACTNNVIIDKDIPNPPASTCKSNFTKNLCVQLPTSQCCVKNTIKQQNLENGETAKIKIPDPPLSTCTKNVTQTNQSVHENNIMNLLDDCKNLCKSTCTKNAFVQIQQDSDKKDIQNVLNTCKSIPKTTGMKEPTIKIEIPDPPSSTCTKSVVSQIKQESDKKDMLSILDACKTVTKSTGIKEPTIKLEIPDPPSSTCTKTVVSQINDTCKSIPKTSGIEELAIKIEIPDPPSSICTKSVVGQKEPTAKLEIPDPPSSTCTKNVVSQINETCKSITKTSPIEELASKIEIPDPPSSTCTKNVVGQKEPTVKLEIPDPPSSTCTKSVVSQINDTCNKSIPKTSGIEELASKIEIPDPPSSTCTKSVVGQKESTAKLEIPDPPSSTCTKNVVSQINDTCKSITKTSAIEELASKIEIPDPPSSTCTKNIVGQKEPTAKLEIPDLPSSTCTKNAVNQINDTCKSIPKTSGIEELASKIEIPDPPSSTCTKNVVGPKEPNIKLEIPDPPSSTCAKSAVSQINDSCKSIPKTSGIEELTSTCTKNDVAQKEPTAKIEIPDPPSSTCSKSVVGQVKQNLNKTDVLDVLDTCKTATESTVRKETSIKIEIPDPPSSTCTKSVVDQVKQYSDKKDIVNKIDKCKTVPSNNVTKEASDKIEIPDPPSSTCNKSASNRPKITCTNQSDIGIENANGPYRSKQQLCNEPRTDEYSSGPYRSIQQVCKRTRSSSKEPTLAGSSNSNSSKNCDKAKVKQKTSKEPTCNNKVTKKEQNQNKSTGTKKEEVKKSSSCNELKKPPNSSTSKTKVSNYVKPKDVYCNPRPTIQTKEFKETKKSSCREKCIEEIKKKKQEISKESKCKNQKEEKKQEVAKNSNKSNKCEDKNKKVDIQKVKVQDTCGMVLKNSSNEKIDKCNKKNATKSDTKKKLNPNEKAENLTTNATNAYCSENQQCFPQTRVLKENLCDLCAFKKAHVLPGTEDFDPNKKATNLLLKSTSTPSDCDKRYHESKFDTKRTDSNAKKPSPKYRSCVNIKANRNENTSSKRQENTCTESKKNNAEAKRSESENSIKTCTNKDISKEDIRKRGICSDIKRPEMGRPVKLVMKENIGADCSSKKKKMESKKECPKPKQLEKCDQLVKEFLNKSKGEGDKKVNIKKDCSEPKKESTKPKESKKGNCDQLIKDALCKSKVEKKAQKIIRSTKSKRDCSQPKTEDPKLKKTANCDELVKQFLLKSKSDYLTKPKKADKKMDSKKDCSKSITKCATPKQSEKCDQLVKEFLLKSKGEKKTEAKVDPKKDCSRPKTESSKTNQPKNCDDLVKEFLRKSKDLGDFSSKRKTNQKKNDSKKDCSKSKQKCATPKQSEKCDQLVKEFLLKSRGGSKSGKHSGAPATPACSGKSNNSPPSSSVKPSPVKAASSPSVNLNRYHLPKSPNADSTKLTKQKDENSSIDLSNPSTILDLTNAVNKAREMLPLQKISEPKKSNARPSIAYHAKNTPKTTDKHTTSASELTKRTDEEDHLYNKYQKLTLDIFHPFTIEDQTKDTKIGKTKSTVPYTSKFDTLNKETLKNQIDNTTNKIKTPLPLKSQRSKSTPSLTISASSHPQHKQQINDHPIFESERCKENETSCLPIFKEIENIKEKTPKRFSISTLKPRVFDLIDDKDMFVCKIQKLSEPSGKVLRTLQCKLIKDEYGRDVFVCNDVTDVSDENGNVKKP